MNYIVQQDGDKYFASNDSFVDLAESDVAFGDTPVEALTKYLAL